MLLWVIRLISFLYYLLLFFVPLVLFPKTSELFEFNKMVLTYGITVIIVTLWLTRSVLVKKFFFKKTLLDIPLMLFLVSQIISTYYSVDVRTSLLGYYSRYHGGLASSLSYALLYWAYVSNMDKQKTKKAIIILLSSGVLVSIYGILEHFGIDKELWVQDVQNRVFSTLGQPNWLAAWLVALIPLTWALMLGEELRAKDEKFQRIIHNNWFWIVISSLFFLTLLYTKSRSGILGFLVAFGVFWGYQYWKSKKNFPEKNIIRKFLALSFTFLILTIIIGTPWTPNINKLLSDPQVALQIEKPQGPALEVGGTESGEIRKIVWRGAINIWLANPFVGSGVETFGFSYYNFRPIEHNLVSEWDFLYNKAHNEYLNILATTGIFGFAGYLLLIIVSIFIFIREIKISIFHLALLSGYISILVTNFFGFSVVPVGLQFFLFPAMSIALEQESGRVKELKSRKITSKQTLLVVLLLTPALILLYSISRYWFADYYYTASRPEKNPGNYQKAAQLLERATRLSPNEAIFWSELADTNADYAIDLDVKDEKKSQQLVQTALEQSDRANNLSPNSIGLKRKRASMFIKLSGFDQNYLVDARNTLVEAVVLAPTDAKILYNLALTLIRTGEVDEALEVLEITINMKENYRDARFAKALVLIDTGETEKAKSELEYILENINPKDVKSVKLLEDL